VPLYSSSSSQASPSGVRAPSGRDERRSRRATTASRRRPVVVVMDLEAFTDEELARLLRFRQRYRPTGRPANARGRGGQSVDAKPVAHARGVAPHR